MPTEQSIDTGGLLTVLGLIAAIWAVIPIESRLRFRLSISWRNWAIIYFVFLLVHYLTFAPILHEMGAYYSFGPWKWGLNESIVVYGVLLLLGLYIFWRSRSPKLATGNIKLFGQLADHLLLTKQYDQLAILLAPQLDKLVGLLGLSIWIRIADKVVPAPAFNATALVAKMHGEVSQTESLFKAIPRKFLFWLDNKLGRQTARQQVREIHWNLITTPGFVRYLAIAHPDLCLTIMKHPGIWTEEFVDHFFDAMLEDTTSRLYIEVKNNDGLNGVYRLALPPTNRILLFFFKDVSVAYRLGVYRSIGECVLRILSDNKHLIEQYNGKLGFYQEVGSKRCPIWTGIKLFEIMVHEGIHQGMQDHLWLHYFPHFADAILDSMRPLQPDDDNHEFASPFYYLLYLLISTTSHWMVDFENIKNIELPPEAKKDEDFNAQYISLEAAEALGRLLQPIITSKKLSSRFKTYMLEVALRAYAKIESKPEAEQVVIAFQTSLLEQILWSPSSYKSDLIPAYAGVDRHLRSSIPGLNEAVNKMISTEYLHS